MLNLSCIYVTILVTLRQVSERPEETLSRAVISLPSEGNPLLLHNLITYRIVSEGDNPPGRGGTDGSFPGFEKVMILLTGNPYLFYILFMAGFKNPQFYH